jgi:hypothetical protein
MNELWGSGNPTSYFPNNYFLAYDDHRYAPLSSPLSPFFPHVPHPNTLTPSRYLKWDSSVTVSQSGYLTNTCNDNRNSDNETPTIVGEFSLSVPDDVQWTSAWDPSMQQAFYSQWFAAQVTKYEQDTSGWIFWAWKSQLGDYRWSYQDAVAAGVIPENVASVNQNACNGY